MQEAESEEAYWSEYDTVEYDIDQGKFYKGITFIIIFFMSD